MTARSPESDLANILNMYEPGDKFLYVTDRAVSPKYYSKLI